MTIVYRFGLVFALLALVVVFSLAAPAFLTVANFQSILFNHFAILSLVAVGMTLVVASGGIDLSIGTAVDMASLGYILLLAQGVHPAEAIAVGLLLAVLVGVFNAGLIATLDIPPFLATLGTLFIGQSIQQLATNGGVPVYLIAGAPRPIFALVDSARLWLVAGGLVASFAVMTYSPFGRRVLALGTGPQVARYSGLSTKTLTLKVLLLSSLLAGIAGIILSSSVKSYAPLSGNAYLMDAIGATFLGTTLNATGRASIVGTLVGVLLLSVVKNGLLLLGVSFYWQQVVSGTLIFLVLAVSFSGKSAAH